MNSIDIDTKPEPLEVGCGRLVSLSLRSAFTSLLILFFAIVSLTPVAPFLARIQYAITVVSNDAPLFLRMMVGLTLVFMLCFVVPEAWMMLRSRRRQA
ncbi:hypothetical protein [Herbaspirillum huttiense]|uniref:hypothetical protein n=1 Tax=Herbaspirillum huttiense TaxID=863372 RepID=UPI0039B09F9F